MDGSDMKSITLRSRQLVATIPSSSGLTFDFQMVVSAKSFTLKLDCLVMLLYKHYVTTNDIALSENGVPQENPMGF